MALKKLKTLSSAFLLVISLLYFIYYAKVIYKSKEPIIAGELISNIFYEMGVQGVCTEDPEAWPDEPVDSAFQSDKDYAVSGYLPVDDQVEHRRSILEEHLSRLERENDIISRVVYQDIQEEVTVPG